MAIVPFGSCEFEFLLVRPSRLQLAVVSTVLPQADSQLRVAGSAATAARCGAGLRRARLRAPARLAHFDVGDGRTRLS